MLLGTKGRVGCSALCIAPIGGTGWILWASAIAVYLLEEMMEDKGFCCFYVATLNINGTSSTWVS